MSQLLSLTNAFNRKTINKFTKDNYIEKISSGKRICRAADDAAGLSISESFKAQVRGLSMSERNTQDGISMIQVADGALGQMNDHLIRMKEIAVEAANGTYTDTEKEAIDKEFQQLKSSIDNIAEQTEFNGSKLLNGDKKITIQVKYEPYVAYDVDFYDVKINKLNMETASISTGALARDSISKVDEAIKTVVSCRSKLGADLNNLNHCFQDNGNAEYSTTSSLTKIEDIDMATAMMKMVKNDILVNYNQTMIASARQTNENVNVILNNWLR